jgi:hypothetical protein
MTKNQTITYSIYGVIWLAVLYPLFVALQNANWQIQESLSAFLFPLAGLLMVSLLWLHAISGSFETWLRQYINFDSFIEITAKIILGCLVLHPLLLLVSMNFNFGDIFAYYGTKFIWLGIISWILLISYDVTKPFKYGFFDKYWNSILIISNIGFVISFTHALAIGGDLASGPLRSVWIFFGVTGIISLLYTYAVLPFVKKTA